jgi:hypothetical protein
MRFQRGAETIIAGTRKIVERKGWLVAQELADDIGERRLARIVAPDNDGRRSIEAEIDIVQQAEVADCDTLNMHG